MSSLSITIAGQLNTISRLRAIVTGHESLMSFVPTILGWQAVLMSAASSLLRGQTSLVKGQTSLAGRAPGTGFDMHVHPVIGNDAWPGTFNQPKKTFAAAKGNNRRVGLVRSQIFREQINTDGLIGCVVGAYGVGDAPQVLGSIRHTSGWTLVSGDIYQKDIGYTAVNAYVVAGTTVTKLIKGTFGSATSLQHAVSGNLVQVNCGAGVNPNTIVIEIPQNSVLDGALVGGNGCSVQDLMLRFWPGNGTDVLNGLNCAVRWCDLSFNSNDGAGVHGTSTNAVIEFNTIRRNGQVRGATGGAPGDGASGHNETTGVIRGNIIEDNEKEGIGHQPGTSFVNEYNFLKNNFLEYVVLGTTGVVKGEQDFRYNVVVFVPSGQTGGNGGILVAASTNRPNVRIYNNTLYVQGTSTTGQVGIRVAGGDVILKNNIFRNFNRGIDHRSTDTNASLVNSHNCISGSVTTYFTNGTPGVVAGVGEFTTDPQFINAASGDFRIGASSPCRGTGTNVGLSLDIAGNDVPSTPDIGAYQYAA